MCAGADLGSDGGGHGLGRTEDRRSRHAHPVPSPGAECKDTGNYIICHTLGDESWANEPDSLLSCGRAYSTGSNHSESIRWYSSEGLLLKRFLRVTGSGTWSLSPNGEGPTVRFFGHFIVGYLATPGEFDSATEIEHGMDFRIWRPGSGVMVHLAGIFAFAPDGGITHHGAGELAIDEEGNLVIPAKEDAALCEALQP